MKVLIHLIQTNLNISNEITFSDVYRSINYIGSLAKFILIPSGSFTLHATQWKPQKNEIHSLNKYSRLSLSRLRLSRITAYLEEKI